MASETMQARDFSMGLISQDQQMQQAVAMMLVPVAINAAGQMVMAYQAVQPLMSGIIQQAALAPQHSEQQAGPEEGTSSQEVQQMPQWAESQPGISHSEDDKDAWVTDDEFEADMPSQTYQPMPQQFAEAPFDQACYNQHAFSLAQMQQNEMDPHFGQYSSVDPSQNGVIYPGQAEPTGQEAIFINHSPARFGHRGRGRWNSERQPKTPGMLSARPAPVKDDYLQHFSEKRILELREELNAGGDRAAAAVDAIRGFVWPLSKDKDGCWLVQDAFECAVKELADELRGHVLEAATGPHSNYVLQKAIVTLSPERVTFIAEELIGKGAKCARQRFACRIFCRLMEHCGDLKATQRLIDEVLELDSEALDLIRHGFGHHVAQSMLEHALPRHKERLASVIQSHLWENANHRAASYVVESALRYCAPADQEQLVHRLQDPAWVGELASSRCGQFVAQTLLQHPSVDARMLAANVSSVANLQKKMEKQSSTPDRLLNSRICVE
eukprot:TRINITY_DN17719_c0_g1_i1.p1 TRINITY_DN17719_c0_g1~~TRINITY_DN17719_c0_g1_i1.p1  ORF type:complete len:498 (+),score=99.62 TRINITY_DN17719_c0_g1_i1:101-1594(+)